MQKRKPKNLILLVIISFLVLVITILDMTLVFGITSNQSRNSGMYKIKSISGELESTINEAEKLTALLAMQAQPLVEDRESLERFIYEQIDIQNKNDNGLFNIYIAGTGWDILPGLTNRAGFEPTKRNWYVGAAKNPGETFVTPPYVDVVTGDVCYTISVMLPDGDTVLGVDYTPENIQVHIAGLKGEGVSKAVIVTPEGIVAGSTDDGMIGKRLVDTYPEYEGIFSLAKSREGIQTSRIRSGIFYENLFAAQSGSGWYLIESENDFELYKESYIQLIFILILTLIFFGIIIFLYILALNNQRKIEIALDSEEQFIKRTTSKIREPLGRILELSDSDYVRISEDHESSFARIHMAAEDLSEQTQELADYSRITGAVLRSESEKRLKQSNTRIGVNKRIRRWVVVFMTAVMLFGLYINMNATFNWGNTRMRNNVGKYEYRLSEWINTQKSILDMFCSIISSNPDMLDDYEGTIDYLDKITQQYPEISATYMSGPDLHPSVFMNTGWKPGPDFKVEERQWYKDTIASSTGWNISAPYYDAQTGYYCVTISKRVYSEQTGEFLGNFGIDFYMDKLVAILGDSYTEDGYAFLVDAQGEIINHPYGRYQMSETNISSVSDLPYGEVKTDGQSTILFRDYDGENKILIAERNEESNFTVYAVSDFAKIYGTMLGYSVVIVIAFVSCIVLVYRLFTRLIYREEKAKESIQEAADAAIAADNAKSRFLAQMSHEIRTPINAVLGMNEMILHKSDDEEIKEYASNIKASGNTLMSLINSILDFSKIEDGKMEIIPVKYDVAELINNLVNSIKGRAESKGLDFETDIDPGLPCELLGDDVRISQIMMNLLTNAVKYTESGCVIMAVKEVSRSGSNIEVEVSVKDTGIGIKKEDMPKLFDSFKRLDEKRNRNIEGTGLGMSIVSRLLEMMDSSLRVDSVYGIGTRFSFVLKQQIVDESVLGDYQKRISDKQKESEEEELVEAGGASVLVVDDNDMNLKVALGLFKLFGIDPEVAMSGVETLELVSKKHYDIIFLDHMMPVMDGIETLQKIRERKLISDDTKVIALTANAVMGAKEQYLSETFDDYLSKPIEMDKLNEILKKYMPDGKKG